MDIETLTSFFMWCTILNGAILIYMSVMGVFAADWLYQKQSLWFALPRPTFDVAIYAFVGAYKLMFILFSLVPLLALLIVG